MNIIVLHGDDIEKSLARLDKFVESAKGRNWSIVRVAAEDVQSPAEKLSSASLFGGKSLFIIEDARKMKNKELGWLKKNSNKLSDTLIIYNDSFLSKTFLTSLPRQTKIEEFKLPKIIFKFLDSFYPQNSAVCLKLMHEVIKKEPPEFVFALLAKQLRDLYWAKVDGKSLAYPDWRISKLKNQSANFSDQQLLTLISEMAKIDIETKTSKANVTSSLDLLIISKLQ